MRNADDWNKNMTHVREKGEEVVKMMNWFPFLPCFLVSLCVADNYFNIKFSLVFSHKMETFG